MAIYLKKYFQLYQLNTMTTSTPKTMSAIEESKLREHCRCLYCPTSSLRFAATRLGVVYPCTASTYLFTTALSVTWLLPSPIYRNVSYKGHKYSSFSSLVSNCPVQLSIGFVSSTFSQFWDSQPIILKSACFFQVILYNYYCFSP